jgi:hypothetical protein
LTPSLTVLFPQHNHFSIEPTSQSIPPGIIMNKNKKGPYGGPWYERGDSGSSRLPDEAKRGKNPFDLTFALESKLIISRYVNQSKRHNWYCKHKNDRAVWLEVEKEALKGLIEASIVRAKQRLGNQE